MSAAQNPWIKRGAALLLIAAVFHLASIWLAPRVIMWGVDRSTSTPELARAGGVILPPPVDATARRIVMPSPDLLYALCPVDLSNGPLHVTANPQWPQYWSIALYAANSDNYFVLNDRQAAGKPVDVWLVPEGGGANASAPVGATLVIAPSTRGLLLMRVLVSDYASEGAGAEKARRTLSCDALKQDRR